MPFFKRLTRAMTLPAPSHVEITPFPCETLEVKQHVKSSSNLVEDVSAQHSQSSEHVDIPTSSSVIVDAPTPLASLGPIWFEHQELSLGVFPKPAMIYRPLPNPLPSGALSSTPPRVQSPSTAYRDDSSGQPAPSSSRSGLYKRSLSFKSRSKSRGSSHDPARKLSKKRRDAAPFLSPQPVQEDFISPGEAKVARQDSTASATDTAESSMILLTPLEPDTTSLLRFESGFYVAAACSEISLLRFVSEGPVHEQAKGLAPTSDLFTKVAESSAGSAGTVCPEAPEVIPPRKSSMHSPPPRTSSLDSADKPSSDPSFGKARKARPSLVRLKSSSTGTLRDSIRSIGEIRTAERASISAVKLARIPPIETTPPSPRRAAPPPPHLTSDPELASPTSSESSRGFQRLMRAMSYGGSKRDARPEPVTEKRALKRKLSKPKMKKSSSTTQVADLRERVLRPLPIPPIPAPPIDLRPRAIRVRSISLDRGQRFGTSRRFLNADGDSGAESRLSSPTIAQMSLPLCTAIDEPHSPAAILHALEATDQQRKSSLRRKGSIALLEYDARRRCRQTLVGIQDDAVFHEVLQTLMGTGDTWVYSQASSLRPMSVASEVAWEKSVRAWFVTRELVKSEKSYGRYLERGIQALSRTLASAASVEPTKRLMTPAITIRQVRTSFSGLDTASAAARIKPTRRASTHPDQLHSTAVSEALTVQTRRSRFKDRGSPTAEHLLRLLAVSDDLSGRFAHDPSPFGVATAFTSMESKLTAEFASWSKEVGSFVGGASRRSAAFQSPSKGSDRLDLSDIIIMPTQRALRYALLFHELASETIFPAAHLQVQLALDAAKRVAAECDRHQMSDLGLPKRSRDGSSAGTRRRKADNATRS